MERYFIDDERDPPKDGNQWVVVRSYDEFFKHMKGEIFFPQFISFDHDLGEPKELDGFAIAKQMVLRDMDCRIRFPGKFDFLVHSENPIGKENIEGLLNSYLKVKKCLQY
jgi:hypothetical protein